MKIYTFYAKLRKHLKNKDSVWLNRMNKIEDNQLDCIIEHKLPDGTYFTNRIRIDDFHTESAKEVAGKLDYIIDAAEGAMKEVEVGEKIKEKIEEEELAK